MNKIFETKLGRAYNFDCFDVMATMPDGCVDMILADLPYGTTDCKWDNVIPFEPMWKEFHRICKPNGAIVLTASQPFTSALVMSNPKAFKTSWIWNKKQSGGFATAKHHPLKITEDCLVFGKGRVNYFPEMRKGVMRKKGGRKGKNPIQSGLTEGFSVENDDYFPTNIIEIVNPRLGKLHPTQKPVALFEYLIKTYTNENDLVFDPTAGSLTTGVAAENLGRRWVCCEKDTEHGYFEKGVARFS